MVIVNKLRCKLRDSLQHYILVRPRWWVLLEDVEVRVSHSQTGCVPAAAPSLGADKAR